jgi:serine/threonine-protein kinase RsbW
MEMRIQSPWAVKLDLESRLDVLEEVQDVAGRLTTAAGLDTDTATDVAVAVRESVVNAITHGNRLDVRKLVHVAFLVHDDALEVVVTDEGPGFDPNALPDPIADANLLNPDGRGILFMRAFMDEVEYSFPSSGGTVVRMRKRLGPSS